MKFEELKQAIEVWSERRNLHIQDPARQAIKTLEEVTELQEALYNENMHNLKDAVGDTIVTLVVLCQQLGIDVLECLEQAYNTIKNRQGRMINGTFVKEEDLDD